MEFREHPPDTWDPAAAFEGHVERGDLPVAVPMKDSRGVTFAVGCFASGNLPSECWSDSDTERARGAVMALAETYATIDKHTDGRRM